MTTDAEHAAVLRRFADELRICLPDVTSPLVFEAEQRAAIERAIELLGWTPTTTARYDYSDPVTYDQRVHRDFCELWTMLAEFDEHLCCSFAYDTDRRLIVQHFHGREVPS